VLTGSSARKLKRGGANLLAGRAWQAALFPLTSQEIPVDKRAEFVWQLSLELHALSNPEAPYEPGLSRSITRAARR